MAATDGEDTDQAQRRGFLGTIAANQSKTFLAAGHDMVTALADGYRLALLIAAGCVLLGLALAPILLRTKETPEEQASHISENMRSPETQEHLVL